MPKLAAVAVLLLASNAFAFEGRPVSDLRFGDHAVMSTFEIATDFTDFMVLTGTRYPTRHVYTQKIVNGRPTGPQRYVGEGVPAGLAWTGTHYLGGWTKDKKLYVATISREGSLTSTPTVIDAGQLATNRNGALAFGYSSGRLTVQSLDLNGRPIGAVAMYDAPKHAQIAVGPAGGGGFGVAFTGYFGTTLMMFRADGTPVTTAPVVVDGPYSDSPLATSYQSNFAAVAANGTDTLVIFSAGEHGKPTELKSVVIGPNGVRKSSHVIHTSLGDTYSIQAQGAIWDGSQYLALANVARAANGGDFDPMFVRIARSGERTGEVVWLEERPGMQTAATLGWDGRQLVVPAGENFSAGGTYSAFCLAVDPVTLKPGPRVSFGRTLDSQTELAIAAGDDGYLAAWFETSDDEVTVRASRIDRAGNYLDGAGIVLGTVPPRPYEMGTISIDGNGPQWFVVWTAGYAYGRTVSRGGVPGAAPIAIGDGEEAAVRWDGTQWVVLHALPSLSSTTISTNGAIGQTQTLFGEIDGYDAYVYYRDPSLVLLDGRLLAIYAEEHGACYMQGCSSDPTVTGLLLDTPGAVPFTIASNNVWGDIEVATSENDVLVTWARSEGLGGAFLSATSPDSPVAPFAIDPLGTPSATAFDGSDFIVAWAKAGKVVIQKIAPDGAAGTRHELPLRNAEFASEPVLAASAAMPVLAGFTGHLEAYDFVPRGTIVFPADIANDAAPSAPSIICATDNGDDTIRLRWNPVHDILGIAIELELADGTFRTIGVAPSNATSAVVAKPELNGSAVRIRAWNSAGVSAPSAIAAGSPAPEAILPSSANACAGVPIEITATLRGNPPFAIRWSDGEQSHVNGYTVTRPVAFAADAMLSIVSVTDASCETGQAASTRIRVAAAPSIDDQTRTVRVSRDQTAALNVTTRTKDVRFAWFTGARGDTSHPVGSNSPTFTTTPAKQNSQYWVRLTTSCGTIDSDAMTVVVNGKRRSVR